VSLLQLREQGAAAEELALAGGDRQQVLRRVGLGVAEGEQLPLGESAGQQLEVVPVAGDLAGVAVQGPVADGPTAITDDVEP
jgi:hypothetical protein